MPTNLSWLFWAYGIGWLLIFGHLDVAASTIAGPAAGAIARSDREEIGTPLSGFRWLPNCFVPGTMIRSGLILRGMGRAAVSTACLAWGILTLPGHLPLWGQTPAKPLTLQISTESGPPGGWAQIKVFAAAPALVSNGRISMDLDPTVFGDIAQVAVFSSTGDAG